MAVNPDDLLARLRAMLDAALEQLEGRFGGVTEADEWLVAQVRKRPRILVTVLAEDPDILKSKAVETAPRVRRLLKQEKFGRRGNPGHAPETLAIVFALKKHFEKSPAEFEKLINSPRFVGIFGGIADLENAKRGPRNRNRRITKAKPRLK